jgi:hypothetical protein
MYKLFFTLSVMVILGFCTSLHAQINNDLLKQDIELNDSLDNKVLFSVANQNFLKNNEYFHDITTGYTLFGSMLSTQVAYLPTPNLRLQAGVFFRKDFGNASLYSVEPLLTLKYQKNGYAVMIGNLEGNLSHRLIEPVFNYERFITNYNENGIQVKIDKKKIWSDTWINWEVMQYYKSNYQEEFAAGNSTILHLIDDGKNRFSIPLQGIITHIGGQVDIDTNAVRSKTNLAIGFDYTRKLDGFFTEFNTKNYYTIYKELAPSKLVAISKGRGAYFNTELKTKYHINASVSYWNGLNYLAPRGGDLFQSMSSYYSQVNVLERNRSLLFVRLLYQKTILENFNLDIRFEPYFDLINQFFEHSYSIYLTYKKDFGLVKLKKK